VQDIKLRTSVRSGGLEKKIFFINLAEHLHMMMMSEKDSQELLWATTNFGLLMRMELKMKKNTGNTVKSFRLK
jgi:hypothetical protein